MEPKKFHIEIKEKIHSEFSKCTDGTITFTQSNIDLTH